LHENPNTGIWVFIFGNSIQMDQESKFLTFQGQTSPFPFLINVDYAKGPYIFAKNGKRYVDMIAGVAVNNIGHNHPKVIEAIKLQTDRHLHVMVYGEFIQDAQVDFAESLASLLPEQLNCVYTVNSGTEAIEAALKLAKRVTQRTEIISCKGAYHGSTHGSMSVSYNEKKKAAFRPLLPGITFIEHNLISDLDKITAKTAAVLIEPVQGDAGVRIASAHYLKQLRAKCTATGTQLIFDEIQCGMGRTGKLFAFEHSGVVPDILTLGKALGGGMPIGAFISNHEKMALLTKHPMLGHITTFGGHPVICAAAKACLDVMKNEVNFQEVEEKGLYIEMQLSLLSAVKEVRRIGLMFAIDMEDETIVSKVVDLCLEKGVITFWFLSHPNSFRLSPPLTMTFEEIKTSTTIICEAIETAQSSIS